jgi:hypothetical protein
MVSGWYFGAMEIRRPPEKETHLAALAASVGQSPGDIVQEAVALWEARRTEQLRTAKHKHTPAEAAARIRELRKGVRLPEGLTIKDLINCGRA